MMPKAEMSLGESTMPPLKVLYATGEEGYILA